MDALRENLVELLQKGPAHVTTERALRGLRPEHRGVRPAPGAHAVWEEFEHMRLAQEDILRYTLDASWKSPAWPEGYWPPQNQTATDEMWKASVDRFFSDLEEFVALVQNPEIDLTARVPHGEWRT